MTNKEAIELLNRIAPMPRRGDGKSITQSLVMEAIVRAIQALEQTSWIPVSERLPEDDGWYLCTICNDIETKVAQIRYFENRGWKAYGWRITAWMNEPQPYEVESEVEE